MKKMITFLMTLILIFTTAACSGSNVVSASEVVAVQSAASEAIVESVETNTVTTTNASELAVHNEVNDDPEDYTWDEATVIPIALNGDSINANGEGVTVDGSKVTILAAGNYSFSGSLTDGQIIVDTNDELAVRLILNGVDIHNSTSAPISILNAEKTVIVLADDTQNIVTDGESYTFADTETDEPNAVIFSTGDLTFYGNGSLTVNGNYNDGIASKDGLVISGGTITVNAGDDGIRGKDYVLVNDGNITVNAQGDGLKADNEEDTTKGYISVQAGAIQITAGGDAITAQTDVIIQDGDFTLTSGGGSANQIDENASAKGIKAVAGVTIEGGDFTINAADDAIHSNGTITILGGAFSISSGDDGMHADSTLNIDGGEIQITQAYEGLESAVISINAGEIYILASDDGINVAGGADGSGFVRSMGPGAGQQPGAASGQEVFTYSGDYYLYINGGYTVVDAAGDGIDVNGAIEMTDGVVIVNGPTEQMNGALDYDASFNMTGGYFVAAGSAGMAQAPGESSNQGSVLINFDSTLPAGSLVHISNSAGEEILTFAPVKEFQSIAFSSPKLVNGETYTVYVGGSSTGAAMDGLYTDGTYTPGTEYTSFTVSSTVTRIGNSGMNRPPNRP